MTFKLRIEQLQPADPRNGFFEPWIRIYLVDGEGRTTDLLNEPQNPEELVRWLVDNAESIRSEPVPFPIELDQSIPQSCDLVESKLEEIERITGSFDMYLAARDVLIHYKNRHCLAYGMSGLNLPEIYFGQGARDGEVSCECDDQHQSWMYRPVDFEEFYLWLRQAVHAKILERTEVSGSQEYLDAWRARKMGNEK